MRQFITEGEYDKDAAYFMVAIKQREEEHERKQGTEEWIDVPISFPRICPVDLASFYQAQALKVSTSSS